MSTQTDTPPAPPVSSIDPIPSSTSTPSTSLLVPAASATTASAVTTYPHSEVGSDHKDKSEDDEEVLRMIKDLDESTRSLLEAIQNSVQYDVTESHPKQEESLSESPPEEVSESLTPTDLNEDYAQQFYENIYLFQARNAFQEGKYSKCLETCRFVRSLNPMNVTAKDLSIRSYLEIGCIAEAYAELSSGVDSVEELYLLGNVYMKMGKLSLYV